MLVAFDRDAGVRRRGWGLGVGHCRAFSSSESMWRPDGIGVRDLAE
jgi:hypothetical protein